jgi:FKBP-type peptidyl-prolyl cis-trans isomerase FkpA
VRQHLLSLFLLLPLALVGCGGSDEPSTPTSPSTPSPTGPAELQLTDLTVGAGDGLLTNSTVVVHYTLWLYDPAGTDSKGARQGSSRDTNQPISFRLGTNAVIPGFEQTINSMRVGGVRRAIVPPSLAYGSTGYQTIPPNTWLVFEVELLTAAN